MGYDSNNVFMKIINNEIPSYKVYENEHVLVILDAFPVCKGHCLLIPKAQGYENIFDMSSDAAMHMYKELPRIANAIRKTFNCDGVNLLQNNGKAAGQEVFHVHMHIIPRYDNDELIQLPASSKTMMEQNVALEVLQNIQQNL